MNELTGPQKKDWAILAYIAGDNDLSDNGLEDIQEVCMEGSDARMHVAVQIDTVGEYTGSIRYEISEPDWSNKAHRIVIARQPESDSGSPRTLYDFLKWGYNRYPAINTLVVIWNHGAGFRTVRRDIAYDDYGSSLDMPEISSVFRKLGIGKMSPITILGFDACLMNMLEIVHHFRDYVSIIVGSQQTEPGDGWPYDKVMRSCKAAKSSQDLAGAIVEDYIKEYKISGEHDVTQSAIDTGKSDQAMSALSDLGDRIVAADNNLLKLLKSLRLQIQSFEFADYVDAVHMGDIIARDVADPAVKRAAAAFVRDVKSCVLRSRSYGKGVNNANGLSVWFPYDREGYLRFRPKYIAMDFWKKHKGWVKFLDAFFS